MSRPVHALSLIAFAAALAACGRDAGDTALASDLQRDLEQARATSVELAPRAGGMQVVSAIERVPPRTTPAPVERAPRRTPTPRPRPTPATAPVQADAEVRGDAEAEVMAPAPVETPKRDEPIVSSPRPRDVPAATPRPRGRIWTTGDVIRNAPFPINP